MTCKLCGLDHKLVDAHIIPRKMYEHMHDGRNASIILSSEDGVYPRRTNTGEYDSNIVCENCEAIFSPWDGYANELLLSDYDEDNYFYGSQGSRLAYIFNNVNYERLKLFFSSVLWRASVSQRDFFHGLS
jgi:hypothetical protein